MKMNVYSDSKSIIISKENVSVISGTDRMLSLGGGIKAKIAKTREGQTVIREFIFDKDRFSDKQAESWIEKNQAQIDNSLKQVQENAPKGSFADITARVCAALSSADVLPKDSDGFQPWCIEWVFPESVIVRMQDKYIQVPYSENDRGIISFGSPAQVEMDFVVAESKSFLESNEKKYTPNCDISESPAFKYKESSGDKRQIIAVLIEAGTNHSKKRYYPERTLQEAAGLFSGLKMFLDHPTEEEDMQKPERSLREWVATIVESWYEDGKILGRVQVHSDWLWESLSTDEVFRNHIGISINAAGRHSYGTIDGQVMEIIEELVSPRSVDWVTEPGARGRVLQLIESAKQKSIKEKEIKMLKTLTLKELQAERPDLVESILKDSDEMKVAADQKAEITRLTEENAKMKLETEARIAQEQTAKQQSKVREIVEASKLPQASKDAVIERNLSVEFKDDAEVQSIVEASIKKEFEFLKKLGVVKVENSEAIKEGASVTANLEARLGLTAEKK